MICGAFECGGRSRNRTGVGGFASRDYIPLSAHPARCFAFHYFVLSCILQPAFRLGSVFGYGPKNHPPCSFLMTEKKRQSNTPSRLAPHSSWTYSAPVNAELQQQVLTAAHLRLTAYSASAIGTQPPRSCQAGTSPDLEVFFKASLAAQAFVMHSHSKLDGSLHPH